MGKWISRSDFAADGGLTFGQIVELWSLGSSTYDFEG